MRKRLAIGMTSLLFVLLATSARTQPTNKVDVFMRAKLEHSQRVLEGLTTGNLELVAKHAQQISLLSQAEMWQVLQTPEYFERSAEFRRATDGLTDAAKNKNLDGATLAYVDMTVKCVNCHKYVRKVKMADAGSPRGIQFAQANSYGQHHAPSP